MKRFAVIFIIGLLLSGVQVMAAQVTNVELSYQEGAVVARINVEGQIRFTHETEVPKNGRPDRVIVDILSATHELGGKKFLDLPACVVESIRSSQFAVTPEKIVRVVFDLKKSPLYKVDVQGNAIVLQFTDKEAHSFAKWSSRDYLAAEKKVEAPKVASASKTPATKSSKQVWAETAARKNKAIESDRQTSLSGEDKSAPAPTKTQPSGFNQVLAQTAPAPVAKKAAPPAAKPAVKAAPKTDAKANQATEAKPAASPKKSSSEKDLVPAPLPKSPSSKTLAAETKPVAKPSAPAAKAQQAPVTIAKKTEPAPAVKKSSSSSKAAPSKGSPKVAQKSEKPASKSKSVSTSRFRRSASNKIKGTLVAEFPKRLVVKYNATHYRDPFKTLIDASRTQNDPVEQRIANVEGLKLVGIIESDGATNRALFEDKEGYGYMLKSGDKVRNGYVLRVETDRVYFQIFEYGWSRTVALKMD